jgi:DNA-binding response OmpR family regulator
MARILAVEDEPTILKMVVKSLQSLGHEVVTAINGRDGLEKVRKYRPHLVVSDITMPEMDGFAFLTELRGRHRQFADMPFIFLSGLSERKDIIAGRALGSDDYVTKPIDFELLLAVVQSRLGQVDRMRALKEEQMVKLYKALSSLKEEAAPGMIAAAMAPPPDPAPAPALAPAPEPPLSPDHAHRVMVVANDEADLEGVVDTMLDAGLHVEVMNSGGALVEAVRRGAPDLVVITYNTIDLQAPMAVLSARSTCDFDFPALLLLPPAMQAVVKSSQIPGFEAQINLPANDRAILSAVHHLLTGGGSR